MNSVEPDIESNDEEPDKENISNEVEKHLSEMKVLLPESIVLRLAKEHIEGKYNYTKEVKSAFNIAASSFIMYLTSNAVESAISKNRKFIWPDDVFRGLQAAGFEDFIEPLRNTQKEYREVQKQLKNRKTLRKIPIDNEQDITDLESDINAPVDNNFIEVLKD